MGEEELMEEVEHMIREELRDMIKSDAPSSQVNAHIDATLEKIEDVATVVPEFGTIAMIILVVSIVTIVAISAKSKLILRV